MLDRQERNSLRNPASNPKKAKIINCQKLNFRRSMEMTNDNIICQISKDTIVTILDKGFGDWCSISFNDVTGYVKTQFLEDVV